ncbi:ribonuclease P protein component [Brachybacterium timonense]|uniref:ribonuclease P protein component n=1 Tax=Brachybacterium timonense TaxID=2050896 RepID=UPI000D0B785A|nr:ribonuclease P protein component [Brachybacterium timonense]
MTWSRHRLRSSDDFRVVTRRGTRAARSHVVVHLAVLPDGPAAPRVGFVVSKRIGNAVVRNLVTRRLREIIRPQLAELPEGTSIVIRALPGIADAPFATLRAQVYDAVDAAVRKYAARHTRGLGA